MLKRAKVAISIFLINILVFGILPIEMNSVMATTPTTFAVSEGGAEAGENITISITMGQNSDYIAAMFELEYDSSKLEYVSNNVREVFLEGTVIVKDVPADSKIKISYMAPVDDNTRNAGKMLDITFKIKSGITVGDATLNLINTQLKDKDGNDVSNTITQGKIQVIKKLNSISLDKTTVDLNKTETYTLTVSYNPTDTTDSKSVVWTSSDNNIATVSNGVIKALKVGTAEITANVNGKTAQCTVNVLSPMTSIDINKTTLNMLKGQAGNIIITYNPMDTTDSKIVDWKTSDATIVKVENGRIIALKEGTATITAKVGGFEKQCTVTVTEIPLNSIAINETNFSILKKATKKLTVLYSPELTTDDKTVIWTSSDDNIVTVDLNGNVKGVKAGTAIITANVGGKTATVTVKVEEKNIENIELSVPTTTGRVGESIQAKLKINPEDTTDDVTVLWTSSDDSVASVDGSGVVALKKAGNVTIKVIVNNRFEKEISMVVEGDSIVNTNQSDNGISKTGDNIWIYAIVGTVMLLGLAVVRIKVTKNNKTDIK